MKDVDSDFERKSISILEDNEILDKFISLGPVLRTILLVDSTIGNFHVNKFPFSIH